MYKKAVMTLVLVNLLFLSCYICILGLDITSEGNVPLSEYTINQAVLADDKSSTLGIATKAASGQRIVGYETITKIVEEEPLYSISEEEYNTLLRIVEAEASGEDEDGKLLVANVVLNRVSSSKFPDSIEAVVFQKSKGVTQFSPVANGQFWKVSISEETISAVLRALEGEDISQGALYFAARKYANSDKMRWFDENLTYLFRHGGHEFFS